MGNPKYCNNMAPNGTPTCCSAKDFDTIRDKWHQYVKKQNDSIYANFYQQIFDNMPDVIAKAKEIQANVVEIAPVEPQKLKKGESPAKKLQEKPQLNQKVR